MKTAETNQTLSVFQVKIFLVFDKTNRFKILKDRLTKMMKQQIFPDSDWSRQIFLILKKFLWIFMEIWETFFGSNYFNNQIFQKTPPILNTSLKNFFCPKITKSVVCSTFGNSVVFFFGPLKNHFTVLSVSENSDKILFR